MNNDLIFIAIGVIYGIAYMVAGLGVTRAVSAMKNRPIGIFEILMWPVVLGVIAGTGDIN